MFKQAVELDRPEQHHLDALSAEGLLEELHAINRAFFHIRGFGREDGRVVGGRITVGNRGRKVCIASALRMRCQLPDESGSYNSSSVSLLGPSRGPSPSFALAATVDNRVTRAPKSAPMSTASDTWSPG